jgi:hypothetical protein
MTAISDLIASTHAAVYTYGIVAAYADDKQSALNYQAVYRRLRDYLMDVASAEGITVPSAAAAYDLPIRISNDATARTVAADLENKLCAQWADVLAYDDKLRTGHFISEPSRAAVRAFSWSGISYAFPS